MMNNENSIFCLYYFCHEDELNLRNAKKSVFFSSSPFLVTQITNSSDKATIANELGTYLNNVFSNRLYDIDCIYFIESSTPPPVFSSENHTEIIYNIDSSLYSNLKRLISQILHSKNYSFAPH